MSLNNIEFALLLKFSLCSINVVYEFNAASSTVTALYVITMFVNSLKTQKIIRFTVLHMSVDVQKLNHVFAIYMYMLYISCNVCAKTLLLFCVCASFKMQRITLLLLRFSTVYEFNVWIKRCYCSVDVINVLYVKADYFNMNFHLLFDYMII
jgi:hypothetical protein